MFSAGRLAAAVVLALWASSTAPVRAQAEDEPVTVSADHPRLLLRPARLRLLRRERERASMRWQQFEALVAGKAPLPERGFALALYHQVSGNADSGRQAVAWALGPGTDLRQLALVFDWCQDVLDEGQRQALAARLESAMASASGDTVATMRSRVLAATALFDHVPAAPRRELTRARDWWKNNVVPAMAAGRNPIARDDAYALFELLHVMRDNTGLDLRESCPQFFKDLPAARLLSYYPAVYPTPENDYYIGASPKSGEPDLRLAALSRAADLEMAAFDTNAVETQALQGWLMHDRFMLRSPFGAPYEFLWANPYQPGLSYYHLSPMHHDAHLGTLFVRSGWEDSAAWFGYFGGGAQLFKDGRVDAVDIRRNQAPLSLGPAVICFGQAARKFRVPEGAQTVFVVGLEPQRPYQVEVDDEEMFEAPADPGGILEVDVQPVREIGLRVREARQGPPPLRLTQ